jgi:GTP cyclohydrolase I
MDREKIIAGVRLILEGVGEDLDREGLQRTPERMAEAYEELFSGLGRSLEE